MYLGFIEVWIDIVGLGVGLMVGVVLFRFDSVL